MFWDVNAADLQGLDKMAVALNECEWWILPWEVQLDVPPDQRCEHLMPCFESCVLCSVHALYDLVLHRDQACIQPFMLAKVLLSQAACCRIHAINVLCFTLCVGDM